MKKVRLKTIQDVRRLLQKVINGVLCDELETGKANCITQTANVMIRALIEGELEARISRLEEKIGGKQ